MADFTYIHTISRGTIGDVELVRYNKTGKNYVLKFFSKTILIDKNLYKKRLFAEVLKKHTNHPFLSNLMWSISKGDRISFVMEYKPHETLKSILTNVRRIPETLTRFYAAEIVLALGHLHEQGRTYKDVNPENILVDEENHI